MLDDHAVAATLDEYAALLELAEADSYAMRAYRRVSGLIRSGRERELQPARALTRED